MRGDPGDASLPSPRHAEARRAFADALAELNRARPFMDGPLTEFTKARLLRALHGAGRSISEAFAGIEGSAVEAEPLRNTARLIDLAIVRPRRASRTTTSMA